MTTAGVMAVTAALGPLRCMAAYATDAAEFQTALNGLAWKETLVGSGPAPVKGALIRCMQ